MRTALILSCFVTLLLVGAVGGQSKSASDPVSGVLAEPQKPAKPPETPEELFEAARWEYHKQQNSTAAINYLHRAIKLRPDYIDGLLLRGNIYAWTGDCRSANGDYTSVIALSDNPLNTYQYRGECKIRLADYRGALKDFDKSIELLVARNQFQIKAFINRGKAKYILQDYDGAISDFKLVFRLRKDPLAVFYGVLTFIRKGDMNSALADLNFLAKYYEEFTRDSRKENPEFYSESKEYPPGQDILAKPKKEKRPSNGITFAVAGVDSGPAKGESEPRFAEFEDRIIPDNWFFPSEKVYVDLLVLDNVDIVFYFLGQIYAGTNRIEDAIAAYGAGIAVKEYSSGRIHFERGKLYLQSGQYEPAVRDFSWAISEKKKLPDAFLERAVALTMMNRDDLAQKDVQSYLKLKPDGVETSKTRIADAKKLRSPLKTK